jgi:hypothetical protein
MKHGNNCLICGEKLRGKQRKYCSLPCKNKELQGYNKQKSKGLSRKLNLIKELGGKCLICGYAKNLSALTFHHIDSGKKLFKLDMRSISNRGIKSILAERNKCLLLCHNCHAELHHPELELSRLL